MATTEGEIPVPAGDVSDAGETTTADNIQAVLEALRLKIAELEKKLQDRKEERKDDYSDPEKLRPIDIKDIEKPDKYDNNISKFNTWFDKFRDLLTNRHASWYKLLKVIEKNGKTIIKDQKQFFESLDDYDDASYKNIKIQSDMYAYQLKAYLRTYTDGELHARVVQTDCGLILELMREIIYKGKNRNPNKLIDLKSKALSPPRAHKAADMNKILTDWKHVRQCIVEEDLNYKMDDETMQTILLKIMPQDYIKDMRDKLTSGKFENDYHGFEQELFDQMSTRKMDEESRKAGGSLGNITKDDDEKPREEFEEIEVWSEELQCNIFGIAKKRDRSRSRSRGRGEEEEERPVKRERQEQDDGGKGGKGKGGKRGSRPVGPCWTCGGPHFQRECPQTNAKGGGGYPITTAWSSWRPGAFPGPTAAQWSSWLPKPWKGKGKGKGQSGKGDKGKGKGYSKGKGKSKGQGQGFDSTGQGNLGELQWDQQQWGQQQWGPPLGSLQYHSWDTGSYYPEELVPICAIRQSTQEDESVWKKVPEKCDEKVVRKQHKDYEIKVSKRFDLIGEDFQEFPNIEQANEIREIKDKTADKMQRMPKKKSQSKKKQALAQEGSKQSCDEHVGIMSTQCMPCMPCRASQCMPMHQKATNKYGREEHMKEHEKILKKKHDFIGGLGLHDDDEFNERAESIRKMCYGERARNEKEQAVMLHHDRPLCAVPQQEEPWAECFPGWQYLALTVDSGAAETVIPHMLVQDYPIYETEASRRGMNYASATGDPIPNLGEKKLPLLTLEGSMRAMTFQAAPVDRPLGSVKRMCSSGHLVVFDEEGSYILNKLTGEVNWMREQNGNYVMDLWVAPSDGQIFQRPR